LPAYAIKIMMGSGSNYQRSIIIPSRRRSPSTALGACPGLGEGANESNLANSTVAFHVPF